MLQTRLTALVAVLAALAGHPLPAQQPATSGIRLDLNIPEQRLVVFDGDSVLRRYVVSVGQPGFDTPVGDFAIERAEWNPWWRPPQGRAWAKDAKVTPPGLDNPMGRLKLFFAPLYYLHGTPKESELGTPASHGCVRMRNQDVIELGTLLHRRARPSVPASAIPAILRRPTQTTWVNFRLPTPLRIRYVPVVVRNGELRVYRDIYKRGGITTEAVYQALLANGFDPSGISRQAVIAVLERARGTSGTFSIPLAEAFGAAALTSSAATPSAP